MISQSVTFKTLGSGSKTTWNDSAISKEDYEIATKNKSTKPIQCAKCSKDLTDEQAQLCEFCNKFYCEDHIEGKVHNCGQKRLF